MDGFGSARNAFEPRGSDEPVHGEQVSLEDTRRSARRGLAKVAARVAARQTARRSKAATRARSESKAPISKSSKREHGNRSNKGSNRVWRS